MERTLTILKPDSVKDGNAGGIISMLEDEGFRIRASKMVHLNRGQAEGILRSSPGASFFSKPRLFHD